MTDETQKPWLIEGDRVKWFPSNADEGQMMMDAFRCHECKRDVDESCDLIIDSLLCETEEGPEEWTALNCYGLGLQCSQFDEVDDE